jgi:hypothetical protein
VGILKDLTESNAAGMYMLAGVLLLGAVATLSVPSRLVDR